MNVKTVYTDDEIKNGYCFPCECAKECEKNMCQDDPIRFCYAKVGAEYGKDEKSPRIMFVGKEPVGKNSEIERPEYVGDVPPTNWHYFGTIASAVMLLTKENLEEADATQENLKKYGNIQEKFVLTNYYKCAFPIKRKNGKTNRQGVHTNNVMKEKCLPLLFKEIELLQPDIVITQGKFFPNEFWHELETRYQEEKTIPSSMCKIGFTQYAYKNKTEKKLFVVFGYHPAARGRLWFNSFDSLREVLLKVREEWDKLVLSEN